MAPAELLNIEVAYSPGPQRCELVSLTLPAGSTVAQALAASGLLQRHGLSAASLRLGVWSQPRTAEHLLRDRDRVEIYRPLKVDPKEARRQRYQRHKESQQARRLG